MPPVGRPGLGAPGYAPRAGRPHQSHARPRVRAWCCRDAFFVSMRRSCEARVGRVFLRILGSIKAARTSSASRSSAARRFCSWLRSSARDVMQDGAVVDDPLPRETAQAVAHGDAEMLRVLRQQEAQLHGARHLVDVLAAGPGGADEFPLQLLVGDRDVLRDDNERHRRRLISRGSVRAHVVHA